MRRPIEVGAGWLHKAVWTLALAAGLTFVAASGSPSGAGTWEARFSVLGVAPGEDNLVAVLKALGPADGLYLVEQEVEEQSANGDWMVAVFWRSFPTNSDPKVRITISIDPSTLVAQYLSVDFYEQGGQDRLLAVERLTEIVRGERRVIRQRLECTGAGLECRLSACDAPDGEIETWLFEEAGATVSPAIERGSVQGVRSITYTRGLPTGQDSYPPCP